MPPGTRTTTVAHHTCPPLALAGSLPLLQKLLLTPGREMTVELVLHMDNGDIEVCGGVSGVHAPRKRA